MPAYVIFTREGAIRDASQMEQYGAKAQGAPPGTMTPLAAYGAIHGLEGEAPDGAVVLQFPSVEEARSWYNHPAYQDAIPHRQKGADYRVFIVEGL